MSPALSATLTLAGAIAAGLPLLWLTAPSPSQAQATASASPSDQKVVHASMYFSGEPAQITLYHEAQPIATFSAPVTENHFTLALPAGDTLEIEYDIVWPDNTAGWKGFTLHLEPEGLESRTETMWTSPEETQLHDIFYFRW